MRTVDQLAIRSSGHPRVWIHGKSYCVLTEWISVPPYYSLFLVHYPQNNLVHKMAVPPEVSERPPSPQEDDSHTTQVESRMAWERVMGSNSPPPVAYDKTSVLILGWDENTDDTKTAEEVSVSRCIAFRVGI
jgi:hypothetical protein